MNEYIKELLLKVVPMEGEDGDLFPSLHTKKQIEEFAELIVRECVRYFNEDYQRDFDTMWREDLSKGIKKHFGVE
jgi:hypothetical protein